MAYCGCLEPLDRNEIGSRGYIIGDIEISNNAYEGLKASAADQAVAAGVKSAVSGRQITTDISIRFVPASGREYKRIELEVNAGDTNGSLLDKAKEAIKSNGERHIYSFYIKGFRDADIKFDTEAIKKLGNICEVTDESLPDYDFDALFRENSDNLIGLFIERIRQKADQDELAKKALYYGIEALLGARDMNK